MSHSSRRTSKFSPGKLALLDLLLEEEGSDSAPALTIPHRKDTDTCPLSFAQERLWFLDQLQPNSPLYNMPAALRLSGPFDVAALQRSLMAVVRRHESLRTTVATVAGQPVQVIASPWAFPLPLIDLQGLTPQAQDAAVQRLATEAAQRPFDLTHGPVFRASVLRLGAQEHALLLNLHHIVADEWSMGVLVRDVTTFYAAYTLRQPARLPELPIQYADYAVWQRGWLQGSGVRGQGSGAREHGDTEIRSSAETQPPTPNTQHPTPVEAQLTYWRTQLADLPTLQLPTDYPRPAVPSFQGARHDFVLSPALNADLGTLSRREGVTLFMTLLATWQVLLARYSQQDDIVVGTPIANRTYKETEDLIGCFVNTLVLRTKMEDHPTFQAVLQRVREVALGAYAHQDLPFEQLVEALQPARDLSHHPLFQVAFALQNAPTASLDPSSLTLRPLLVAHSTAKFDLSLAFAEAGPELAGMLEYRIDLFETSTIARMTGHLETLLAGIVADPAQRLADLPLLTDAERRQLLVDWNATARDYPQDAYLHHLFESQVGRSPDAIAVVFDGPSTTDHRPPTTNHRGDKETRRHRDTEIRPSAETQPPTPNTQHPTPNTQHLTYAELNRRANQLAHYLQSLGIGPEVRVGLCLERSLEVIVGLLGILKAGGAYVPLVPSYPTERLAFMLEDAQVPVLLTRQQFISRLPLHTTLVVCLDADWPAVAQLCTETPASTTRPEHLAYLIYTSGTTGRPKAVMVEHHNIVNTLRASQSAYHFTPHDRVPCLLSFSFDITLFECLSPLLVGGVTILVPEEHVLDFPQWSRLLSEITFLHGPPSLLRQIVSFAQAAEGYSRYDQLRQVAVGGDVIPPELIQDMQHVFAMAQVYVGYGPTEGTIMCTNYPVPRDAPPHKHVIGRPMQNMQVRLYDPDQRLVPIGVPGELYIGGMGVTRGYLHQEALTNDKYVVIDGQRWYRTGDRACYLPDGNLVFLGRIDEQIKVRGFRIEPGEIETVLTDHPNVQESVVVAQADEEGEKRLVAYVVLRTEGRGLSGADSSVLSPQSSVLAELRAFLQERLPDYMVPSVFVLLDTLPLTPNRKVDRRALPAPDSSRSLHASLFVAPSTPVEEILAQIWADVLRLDRVGAHDNFFALGGHSLLATQVIARVRTTLVVELPLRDLFEAPTIAALAARIALVQRAVRGLPTPPLLPETRTRPLPLSFAQQRLWFLDQLQPDSSLYTLPTALHVSGPLDVAALQQSLAAVVRRHEALRTTIGLVAGQLVQVIAPPQAVPLLLLDLQSLPTPLRDAVALGLAIAEARRPFDLARGPVLRAVVLRLAVDEHVLLLTMHHIAADGWSMSVLVRDLTTLYAAYAGGQPASLPALPLQYADYAVWQRTWLQGAVLDAELAYWRAQLAALPTLQLPTDHARPAVPSFGGVSHAFALPTPVSLDLAALSQHEGVTLFMTLLAAFAVLLARYSGQDDIVAGTPIANRTHKETENLIGFFVNTLVLRSDLAGNPSFSELLGRIRAMCLDAYAHQDLPFEKLVEELQPARDLSRQPLFQVMFALQNTPQEAVTLPALTFRPLEVEPATAKFDLSLAFVETESGLAGVVEYSTDLFVAPTIARMVGHLTTLLTGIVADPARRLAALPLLSDAERTQLLVEWNATEADYRLDSCFHQLFERQAERTPDAIAVVYAGTGDWGLGIGDWEPARTPNTQHLTPNIQQFTYRELNQRANRLAHYLRSLGAGPERLIAICIQRSLEMLVGILGVLKAGGAYVPFDPTYPAERLAFMLEDTQPVVLLTQKSIYDLRFTIYDLPTNDDQVQELKTQNPKLKTPVVVCIDTDAVQIARMSEANPATPVIVENLAYVIYTSGSTGRPKGVQVPHRGLCNLARMMRQTFGLGPESHVLQLASFSFDASFWDLLLAFPAGATLCIAAEEARLPGPDLARLLDTHAITNASLTPSMLASLPVEPYPTLRTLITTGEACTPDIVARWAPGRRFLNGYGPTEVTVGATIGECSDARRRPTIGRPFANTQVYLLDQYQQPVPIGVPGEVYIGGVGVARGYLNRPDLTAERFIPNPFWGVLGDRCWVSGVESSNTQHPTPNTRLYRTGDLACYRTDGMLDFLGRVDQQVKIRGFRVELGEIEAVLSQHPAVRESVVLAREDAPGEQRLVAYVVMRTEGRGLSGADSSVLSPQSSVLSELRSFLQERLPDYMVPSAFVLLDALPLTTHGKVDRRALPAPDPRHTARDTPFVAPRTPAEEVLAQLWADVLRLERVGRDDNFFTLGGHSLLATQLISRVRETFQVALPLRALFEAPTIAGLAEQIVIARRDTQSPLAPPLRPVPRNRPLPLSFAQQRLWVLDQIESNSPAYNLPNAIRLAGPFDIGALRQSLNMVVRRHEALRTTFAVEDGQPVQVIAPPRAMTLPVLDLRALPEDEREQAAQLLARTDAHCPFDLARGPLLRATLLRLTGQDHVILLNMHHIVADGWSMIVLVREVTALYTAHVTGQPASLPELPIQYADYAAWQRGWLQGPVLEAQLTYWRRQLADLPVLQLPTDRPRPPSPSFQGASYPFLPPSALHADLLAFSRAEGVTLFMTLLAAFQVLLARYSDQDDIAVGTDVANRTQAEIEPLIGFFINQLVLRGDLRANPTFRALLQQVRVRALDAYTHQDLPFEQLVKELNPVRSLTYSPLFQVKITMQNMPPAAEATAGLNIQPLGDDSSFARFDLVLALVEDTDRLAGTLEYRTDLFDAATIARMAGHYQTLLEAIVGAPTRRLADLPILTATEQRQLLADWNATSTATTIEDCIQQLFAAQVARSPDAIALVFDRPPTTARGQGSGVRGQGTRRQGDKEIRPSAETQPPTPNTQHLTYDELNTRANQLAHYLQRLGVRPEVRVGLCAERSLDMLIGLLGILKAGGAYVPLDPNYPSARLAYMMEDSQTSLLLTQTRLIDRLPTSWLPVVCLDDWTAIAHECAEAPSSGAYADNLAYMIYTSGSTGMPKGVLVAHRGLCNLVAAQIATFGVRPDSRVLQFASLSFDAAVSEVFMALAAGATLYLALPATLLPGPDLHQFLHVQAITTATLPPSALVVLPNPTLPALQTLIAAGEACPADLAARWANGRCFLNAYGPTEVTVCATIGESGDSTYPPPIGRPIANTQVYLLDAHMQPVPVGVPGELYVGGVGVARGYLHRPELTAERFVPNPFAGVLGDGCWVLEDSPPDTHHPTPTTRLYRTGDLARYHPDSMIEFLGRIDAQVKVRGYRIELGEIEALLQRHPEVSEAVVLAREDTPGDQRLAAYVIPIQELRTKNQEPDAGREGGSWFSVLGSGELRGFLKERLPDYMVPSAFVLLEALPLTASGKVDRKALPVPGSLQSGQEDTFITPRTPDEELLAGIWAEVLQLDHVGAHDNFFTLGGHSLLGAQIVARVYDAFGVELPLRRLFETPTLADLAAQIASARQSAPVLQAPPLRHAARAGAPPLSFAQQRLWFLDQLQAFSPAYNIPTAVRLTTPLDIAALTQSLSTIMGRHEALRTTFALVEGQLVQVIASPAPVPLQIVDLHDLPETERAATMLRLAVEESRQPFDLARGPLLRARLVRVGAEDNVVLLTMHHIVSDGWSAGVFVRELIALYAACAAGRPARLPELPIQYADYAIWQREWLHGAVLEAHLAYWRTQLADLPALDLPIDHPRPSVPTFAGARGSFTLPRSLSEALVVLSRRQGVTLFMTLLTAWQVLLARYSSQDDIAVGTPVANRSRAETENLIGCFINTLVLRTDLAGNPTFHELLRRVREMALESYAHQELPFEQVVEAIQPERDLSRHPLFQVLFMLQNAPVAPLELPNMALRPLAIERDTAQFDLTLSVEQTRAGLVGSLEYRTDLFEAPTIMRMLEHLRVLLEGIVADPGLRIAALPLLTDDERRQLLVDWNATAINYPHERCIHQLFAAQAARTPDAVALVFEGPLLRQGDKETRRQGDIGSGRSAETQPPTPNIQHPTPNTQHLTYHELDARADRLARYLRQIGVGPEVHVGLCLERSLELIVGLLGILKAGGAYVPLDLAYPAERLTFMLADAQAPVVLTRRQLLDKLPKITARQVALDGEWEPDTDARAPRTGALVTSENLAYVIYTSGSTGQPKGVQVAHRGLGNLAAVQIAAFGVRPESHVLQFASFSFDAAVSELWMALLAGATLHLAPRSALLPGPDLLGLLRTHAISHVTLPPSALAALPPTTLPALQTLIVAGEACPAALIQAWAPGRRFVNAYGPTEATVCTTLAVCASDQRAAAIGRPIANTQVYVLNARQQPVPCGVTGELYIGGAGLARGYLNRPDLTAAAFIPNPFGGVLGVGCWVLEDSAPNTQHPTPNTRLYRTGDLVRYRADGALEFVGRRDAQIKLRGFRIELGEVEAVLQQHPAVRESVVLAREDLPGDKRLVAYVVQGSGVRGQGSEDAALIPDPRSLIPELRAFLQNRLPDYMVPSAFVALAALPLTANGKVNIQALPTPDGDNAEARSAYQAPRDSVELALTRIWEDILGIRTIGVTDNFFELGGHSLLVVSLMTRVRQQFGYDLPLATLFRGPTIEQLAALLRQHTHALSYSPIVEIQPGRSKPPFFCVHPAGGTVLCYAELSCQLGPDYPFYGLQARGLYGEQGPFRCIEDMAAEYIAALRAVQPHGPYFLGGWSMGGIVAFEMAQQLHRQGQEVALLALLDVLAPVSGNQGASPDDTRLLAELVGKENLPIPFEAFQQLAPDEQVHRALDAARQANFLPMGIGVVDVQRFLRVWNANILAISSYVPQVYPSRITLFKTELPTEDAGAPEIADPTLGWSALSTQPVAVYTVPGTHQTMVSEPHVQILAEQLRNWLNTSPSDGQKAHELLPDDADALPPTPETLL